MGSGIMLKYNDTSQQNEQATFYIVITSHLIFMTWGTLLLNVHVQYTAHKRSKESKHILLHTHTCVCVALLPSHNPILV